jgi:hypothetical protein
MELTISKEKTSEEQKEKLKNLFESNDIEKNIVKNNIDSEQYKVEPKKTFTVEQPNKPLFSSIRKDVGSVLEKILQEQNEVNNYYMNSTNNSTARKIEENNTFISPKTIKNSSTDLFNQQKNVTNIENNSSNQQKNIDFGSIFKPSKNVLNEINQKFNTSSDLNVNNVLKTSPTIPALKDGGIVTKPTVSYLHENEAVIPLNKTEKVNKFITSLTRNNANNMVKNEGSENISQIRNHTNSKAINQQNYQMTMMEHAQKVQKMQPQVINAGSGGGSTQAPNSLDQGTADVGAVYAGSTSRSDFMMSTYRFPTWRTAMG